MIRILQSILGLPESPDEDLVDKDLSELQAMIETLRLQIVTRPSE
jgi:hypothetical protein